MHWHILGAGALGCLFAARLREAGIETSLVLRSAERLEQLVAKSSHITVHDSAGDRDLPVSGDLIDGAGSISHLLVTTKAYDTDRALASVKHRLTPGAQILLLQNGCGHQQAIARRFSGQPVWAGITTSGARRISPFEILVSGEGETRIGPLNPLATERGALPDGWQALRPPAIAVEIEQALWQKLTINAAINPLTALLGCANGELISDEHLPRLTALCHEIETVASACHQPLFETPLIDQVIRVARDTAANRSSMLEDISAGRPTEIEQITGFLCREAEAAGITAPLNRELLDAVTYKQAIT
ncbi:ketopantoate reductase family protein [Marinobacterium sp. YM272]|uniref:ketopantoate reductase family protein n=1 Tax=Marinobacterium sp. YM272 TaxID=3421654 RepID=UPI003D7FDF10